MCTHSRERQRHTETERQRERFNHTGFNNFLELNECYSAYRYSLVQLNDTNYKLTQAKKEVYGTKSWKVPRTNLLTVVSQRTYGEHCLLQITMEQDVNSIAKTEAHRLIAYRFYWESATCA